MATKNVRTLIVVPARGGSKGVPRKNLRRLGGEPLIVHILRTADGIENAHLVVSPDDDEIAEVARQCGAEVIIRPPELASDEATLDQAVIHVWEHAVPAHQHQHLPEERLRIVFPLPHRSIGKSRVSSLQPPHPGIQGRRGAYR